MWASTWPERSQSSVPIWCWYIFGHNEFLGIGGNASHTSPLFQLNQLASRLRIYQVLKRLLSPDGDLPASLLEIMANVPGTALGDQSYEATLTAYGQSLEAIVDVLSSVQAEVLILGVARNLRDFPPFRSEIRRSQSEKDDLAARLDRLVVSGQPLPGVTQVEDALTSYALGKALLRSGRHQQARQYLERACDLDQLRFRASTGIRHVAREICREGICGYLDLQPIVDELSPEGIAGNDTFVDQVHPSLAVHDLLARTLADLILRRHFADVAIDRSFAKVELQSTLVDRIKAASTLETLYRTAMFKELGYHNDLAQREVLPGSRRRDLEYIQSVYPSFPATYQLHISYGAWLIKQRRHQEAFAEFRQAATLNRFSISARNNLALMHANRGRYDEALEVLQELIDLDVDDPRLWESVYRLHVLAGRDEDARKLRSRLPGNGEILEDSRGLRLYEF
jgi:Flp pilus assembly protein TadD